MKGLIFGLCLLMAGTLSAFQPQDDDSCWGKDTRCQDGHYRAPDGTIQPDTCATHENDTHPCECQRATACVGGGPNGGQEPGAKCKTYCRKNACSCVTKDCS